MYQKRERQISTVIAQQKGKGQLWILNHEVNFSRGKSYILNSYVFPFLHFECQWLFS